MGGWTESWRCIPAGTVRPGLPVMMVGIYKLFMPEPPVDLWYMLIWNMVVYLGWTIMILPYGAWGAELSDNYMDRARITASRQVWVIAGLIGASVVIWFFQEVMGANRHCLFA